VVHELRIPIQPILAVAELMESTLQKNEESVSSQYPPAATANLQEEIEIIVRNARRLYKLSEDILDIAKIENNSLILHKSLFDLKEDVIEPLIEDCKKQIEMDGREMKVTYLPRFNGNNNDNDNLNPKVYADKERIMQVMGNLLSNALKFTQNGAITITTEDNKNHLVVKVSSRHWLRY
jgi:signal transduction histidine kinase